MCFVGGLGVRVLGFGVGEVGGSRFRACSVFV